jgi:HAD superfamily hydrolase (TIGR01484 family)
MTRPEFVLAVDLDGTLLAENDRIHPADLEFLLNNPPVQVIIATGRPWTGIRRVIELNGIAAADQTSRFPLVINNGAMQLLPGDKLHQHNAFVAEVRRGLAELAGDHPEATFIFQGAYDSWRIGHTHDGDLGVAAYGYQPLDTTPADAERLPFSKVLCISRDRPLLDAIARDMAQFPVSGNYSLNDIYEVTPRGVDKAFGIERLLPALGLMDYPLVVAGDGENDESMFAIADCSFAPLNATDRIRQMADVVFDRRPRGLLRPIYEMVMERAMQGRSRAARSAAG